MESTESQLRAILGALEKRYGRLEPAGPRDPYEMILFVTCGYPATDISCARGYEALKREVGTKPRVLRRAAQGNDFRDVE